MKCEEIEKLLVDYLDKTLDEKTRDQVDIHLSTCERCLDSFNESQKMFTMMSGAELSMPDDSLRSNFYHMLEKEIRQSDSHHGLRIDNKRGEYRKIFLAAAGIALFIAGTFLGSLFTERNSDLTTAEKIEMLQAQIDEIKLNEMLSMLEEESSSYRLQGVSYAEELGQNDDKVIGSLINTLNNDRNTNVRLAAAFSLSKFTGSRMVCDSLVASLPRQYDPIVQITLINILVEIKEKSALRPIDRIINDKRTIEEVRSVAEKGARALLL